MTRRNVVLAALLAAVGCSKAKPPPISPALADAIAAADDAVDTAGAVGPACEALAMELSTHKSKPGVPIPMQADLHKLSMEIATFGATSDPVTLTGGRQLDTARWKELRGQLDRVLRGEKPTPGPRYQISMPQEVSDAIDAADAALASGDIPAARQAVWKVRAAIARWAEKMPGPRAARLMQAAEMEVLPSAPGPDELQQLRAQLARLKEATQPVRR